ncbi:unnamed protein product (macronuclear) [Paramecium tetraurelia]|uniref:Dynein heavy chain n=1 Tax=Paramecium tetraurelia TaxID=5888 RepID=A0DWG1_PARTE|nr:uncharacterized protein GSPATT00021020001 [Paramecium tetraurelia]CAK87378.1 unnamed protein product [Paramecium tetraurelia]|eukprot:XP_001454775.1 hypothetical protein (macronuclear) [Paramecium tetraurelia strain d4-2]
MIQIVNDDLIPQNIKANSRLRDAYIKYQELVSRGKIKLKMNKQINCDIGQQLYFFKHKDALFFQHPDKQQEYYESLLNSLTKQIKPQKAISYEKQLLLQIQALNQQKYTPDTLKNEITSLFKRKISQLKIRKQRTFQQEGNIQKPEAESIYKYRIQWIDNQIINLNQRLERLRIDDGIKIQQDNQQALYSNIFVDDVEIYLRNKIYFDKIKMPFRKLKYVLKWMHFLDRFEIQENANKIVNQLRVQNGEQNQQYFNDNVTNIEGKLNLKYYVVLQLQEYLKPLKFSLDESRITQRFDRLPLVILTDYEMHNRLYQIASKFLKNPRQFGEQKLIFHLCNLQHMLDGYQKYLYAWDKSEKNEYDGYSGLQKLTIELSAFDDSEELIKQLNYPLPIYPNLSLVYVKNDWKMLLNCKNIVPDEYQTFMSNKLNFVTVDAYTEKLIQLLPIHLNKSMQAYIDQQIKQIRSDNYALFNIIENNDYIEYTRESLRLKQINELYEQICNKEIHYRHKTKFKSDLVKAFEELMIELTPKETHLQAYFSTMVCKMREFHRKIFYIVNALQSIERKLTFNLLSLRECKVNTTVDTQFLIKVNQLQKQDTADQQINQFINQRRNAVISYIDATEKSSQKVKQNLSPELKFCRVEDEIQYSNEELPDVFVNQKIQNPIYDSTIDEFKRIMKRIVQSISLYINKYEKISSIKSINPIVDRFQCALDCLEQEAIYQFQKLKLVQTYMKIFDNTVDQYQASEIIETIFEIIQAIPLLDLESFYFKDSYILNQDLLKSQREFMELLINKQQEHEIAQVKQIHEQYLLMRMQQDEIERVLSRAETPKIEQKSARDQRLNEQYDYYNVSNKMSQIFQELNTTNKQSAVNLNSNSKDLKIIDPNAILLPFQILEDYNGLNFTESLYLVTFIIKTFKNSFQMLLEQFPQNSIQGYLSLQIASMKQAQVYEFQDQKLPYVKKFHENTFFESEYGLIQKYFDRIKSTVQNDISPYILNVSLYDLERTLNQQQIQITDIGAINNLMEYLRLRKHFLNIQLEMKVQHRIHKKIHGYQKMSKTNDLYFKSNLVETQSQYKKNQAVKYCFSPFCFEIDATQEVPFILLKQFELLVFNDVIEEFRNILLYDQINVMFLQTQNELRFNYIDDYIKAQLDLKHFAQVGYLPQNSKLTIKQISQYEFNDKLLLASLPKKPTEIDDYLKQAKSVKAELFIKYVNKYKERPRVNSFQSDKMQILSIKKDQNLKLYLIKRLIQDFLSITQHEAIKVDIFSKEMRIKRISQVIPSSSQIDKSFFLSFQEEQTVYVQQFKRIAEKLETHIHIDQFYSRDDFQNQKQQDPNRELRQYYKSIHQYLMEVLRHNTIFLNWFELMHMNELYLFNLSFDYYDQTKEMLYQGKLGKNPIKSVLEYDKNQMDIKQCISDQVIEQRPLVAQAIDKMIDKIKSFYQINKAFEPFLQQIELFKSKSKMTEITPEIKQSYLNLYSKTYYIYNQCKFFISKDYPDSEYYYQYQQINQCLFLQHQFSAVNLNFFKTIYVRYQNMYKVKQKDLYRKFKKLNSNTYSDEIRMINLVLPINNENLLTHYHNEQHQNVSLMLQVPGVIGVNERIMLRKQNVNEIKEQCISTLLSNTYVLLQNPYIYNMSSVELKLYYNDLEIQLKDQKITLKELVYNQLTNTSIKAMNENVHLLQQYLNVAPEYIEKAEIMDKLVSKINIAIPRVKFIQSLQSTLSQKSGEIHSALKIAFIQGFLNRLRNKSIQTNLLVSGMGYSISSQDIEDCLNILNRDLYTFAENEIAARMETFNLIYEQQKTQIKQLNRQLKEKTLEHDQLKQSFDERLQALVIAKSNKILFDLDMLKSKFKDYQKCTLGLEENIREQIESKYKIHVEQLTFERDRVIEKFMDLKQQLITLFTQEVQTNQDALIKFIQQKTNEMLSEIPLYKRSHSQGNDLNENGHQGEQHQKVELLFEPYKFTKALHQLKDKWQQETEDQKINYEKQIQQTFKFYSQILQITMFGI